MAKEDRNTTDNFEKKVAVDGPVVNEGELGSSTFSPGQVSPTGPLGVGQRWTVTRKREVVLRLLRGEPVDLLSRQLGVEVFRLERWREKAIGGSNQSPPVLRVPGGDVCPGERPREIITTKFSKAHHTICAVDCTPSVVRPAANGSDHGRPVA